MRPESMKRDLARLKACREKMSREAYDKLKSKILRGQEPEQVEQLLRIYEGRGQG
jgi:hypothetical protein